MTYILSILAIGLIALFILVRYLEAKSVFYPSKQMNMNPSFFQLQWEDAWMTTSDQVKIHGWFVKNPNASTIILYSHGNAGNISDRLMKLKFFHDLGFAVLVYDYRGFGQSLGKPTEQGIYRDAQAAFDWIKQQPTLVDKKIVAYGTSLGGIVAIDLATQRPVDALVVDSSITSGKDMAKRLYPFIPSFFMAIKFDSISKIKSITVPKLIVHSPDDKLVPYSMGQALFNTAVEPTAFIDVHGGHNDAQMTNDPHAVEQFLTFLRQYNL